MRLQGKRFLGRLWNLLPRAADRRIILIYHAVGSGPLSHSVEMFDRQMAWLAEHASVETLDQLLGDDRKGGLRVALTFDDGYRSLHGVVAPILRSHRFPATVYLNTGWVDEVTPRPSNAGLGHYPDEEFLLWREVSELAASDWNIGSHGVDHVALPPLAPDEIDRQVGDAKREIEARLGSPCRHFAYTWGRHDAGARQAMPKAGYVSAVAAHHAPLVAGDDPFALPRMDVRRDYTLDDFTAILTGAWDYLGILHRLKGCR